MTEQTTTPATLTERKRNELSWMRELATDRAAEVRAQMNEATPRRQAGMLPELIRLSAEAAIYTAALEDVTQAERAIGRAIADVTGSSSTDPSENAARLAEQDGALRALAHLRGVVDCEAILFGRKR